MKKLVVLTGAGISAESGLKTFRDSDGLWEGYKIEDVATPGAWKQDPQMVLDFYNHRRKDITRAQPNAAHAGLVELEKDFDVQIITQNIDDLHERAGSTHVLHLHGEIFKMCSERNNGGIKEIRGDIRLGDLDDRGHQYRPAIVWFEEPVTMIEEAARIVRGADIFVIVGTSLQVYPAAGLIQYASWSARKFIIDTKIPYTNQFQGLTTIESTASEGVKELKQLIIN